jgi:ABC-2 type transport system permease protein
MLRRRRRDTPTAGRATGNRTTAWPRYRKYLEFLKKSFQSAIAFRVNTLLSVLGSILWIFVQVSIWRALLANPVQDIGTTAREMVTYVIVSALVGALTGNSLLSWIEWEILSGEITGSLIKPMSLKLYMIANNLGNTLFVFVFKMIPILVIGIFVFGMQGPASPAHAALFFCSMIGGAIVSISLSYTVGLLAFWYLVTWHTHMVLGSLMTLFSGSVVPLWFFPRAFSTIAEWLPFRLIYHVPISIYLGRMSIVGSVVALAQQLLWVLVLYGLERLLWSRGIRRLVIQGG